ncbi:4-hydroxythreonine-4-phosphate dehydrogenase [Halomicronema hongdechloris C2206]|uniref:4-hydroxythreonine-4-phosphate dehydrogenase n=1 Tax=Halomicronema hongdechloris C2206 TaxID=1641165 RepID=A0A1Z3HKE7_9CYAN|nr:4-hydroxythreonine-4-phosphate dehydrogenase PdxA [Halomicronema hongdechloris]ASC70765.1 4-hydroxythreonine-4-phosphate dehydrogenase [Halomicronema hongdechloris C2206]
MPSSLSAASPAPVRLVIPMGDPAGIGPEVVLKALADDRLTQAARITVVGSRLLLQRTYDQLAPAAKMADPATLDIWSEDLPLETLPGGQGTAASGAASFGYLKMALAATLVGQFQGIVTAPIAKSAWHAAGHEYPGQTEVLAEAAGCHRFAMAFVARSPHTGWQLRALLATTHIPLAQVPQALTPELLSQKLALLLAGLQQDFGVSRPRVAIAGLNPHSGEQGRLGIEETTWIIPWLQQQRQRYPQAELVGPIPPDTLWVGPGQAWYGTTASTSTYDAYLALYHDQGLIPVKLMAFDRAVNTTLGLPFVRTSPDHGTAFDIAGQGIADATSMTAAIALALELIQQRQANQGRLNLGNG